MTSKKMQRARRLGIGSALILAFWLATALAAAAQTFTTLYNFDWTHGAAPDEPLVQGRDGNFYGVALFGGTHGAGAIFKITPQGTLTTLHSFLSCTNRHIGASGLALGVDGNFYGASSCGGSHQSGTVFKIAPGGRFTTLYSFCTQTNCPDGAFPSGLVLASSGNFYGATGGGGAYGEGTIFKITPAGALTTLYSFCSQANCPDGSAPYGPLVQATGGNFYGMTRSGGASSYGTFFKITAAGKLTTLLSFDRSDADENGLIQASDGNFYGTTWEGGDYLAGSVVQLTPTGTLTTLYSFCANPINYICPDGAVLTAGLMPATDGNSYGTTSVGGNASNSGTIFQVTPAGALTTVHSFSNYPIDGADPYAPPLQATNGILYGTTWAGAGGANGADGTVWSLDMGFGPFITFVLDSGKAGAKAEILGQGFTGTTGVSFNGTPATFAVKSDTYLTATVPVGATTGPVTVTTPSATLTSNVPFRVRP